tara:strand:- start:6302 stop:6679 length:378 start_codon:yes stop_codon:yes gene_type:complete
VLKDTTFNITLSISNYEGRFVSEYNKNIEFGSYISTTNTIVLDTVGHTLSVIRKSKDSDEIIKWDLTISHIIPNEDLGITYNFQNHSTGGYGFLYIQDNGIIIFVSKTTTMKDTYLGFLGFLDQK